MSWKVGLAEAAPLVSWTAGPFGVSGFTGGFPSARIRHTREELADQTQGDVMAPESFASVSFRLLPEATSASASSRPSGEVRTRESNRESGENWTSRIRRPPGISTATGGFPLVFAGPGAGIGMSLRPVANVSRDPE